MYRIFEIDRHVPVTLETIGTRVHPEDLSAYTEELERSRRDGGDVHIEMRLQMPDLRVKYVQAVAHCRQGSGQLEYIGAVQDVTQRRLSEETLAEVRSELASVARVTSLGVLTASIAHEVNQPLAGIITNARSLDPKKYDCLSQVFQAASLTSSRKLASAASKRSKARWAAAEPCGFSEQAGRRARV